MLIGLIGSTCRINYSGGNFTVDGGYEGHAVVQVTWYGAIMFCNWLTEMKDGNTTNLVYTGMDSTWDHSETVEDQSRTGYRLPSSDEWEFAARYRGNNNVNTVAGYSNPYFTTGNSASGATTYHDDLAGAPNFAGKVANDMVAVYKFYWDGSLWIDKGTSGTAEAKSLGIASANTLGLYDMSGNVFEWCFTVYNVSYRLTLGGSWNENARNLQVGVWDYLNEPFGGLEDIGFRIAKTQ